MALTSGEMSTLLSVMSLLADEYRDVLVPHELDGDVLDRLYDRVLDETKRLVIECDHCMPEPCTC